MKYILILFAVSILACSPTKRINNSVEDQQHSYMVYKLDSINSYYLIYARSKDSLYKIVSEKTVASAGEQIRPNGRYAFNLRSRLSAFRIGNVLVSPQSSNVNCFAFDEETNICLEGDSIRDLYQAENVKGLSFLKNK